jgi:major histocompatibility complex class I
MMQLSLTFKNIPRKRRGMVKVKVSVLELDVVAHTFNPSTWEAEAGRFLSSRTAWSTE